MAVINGTDGPDNLLGTEEEDVINGFAGKDIIDSLDQDFFGNFFAPRRDFVDAGDGDDTVAAGKLDQLNGGLGDDVLILNLTYNGPAGSAPPIRLLLNGAGTGKASDGTSITGFESMYVSLTQGNDVIDTADVRAVIDAYSGNDRITTGSGNDSVLGGAGNDTISTGAGDDFINAGLGNDFVFGGDGADTFNVNILTDGTDQVDLGAGDDRVLVERTDGRSGQVRLTFTSSEVGNGDAQDSGSLANQDGGLAIRVQSEAPNGNLQGRISRYDDEGITFDAATTGITFDVRDLVSGAARGDQFQVVTLGTAGDDTVTADRVNSAYYVNGGQGNDTITGARANDFLVGGAGNDQLFGLNGDDRFIGGGGDDSIDGGNGTDRAILSFARADATYTLTRDSVTIVSTEGSDTYTSVEEFQFSNGDVVSFADLLIL